MTQHELNREVARATGESINFIREMGFSYVESPDHPPPTKKDGHANGHKLHKKRRWYALATTQLRQVG